MRLSEASARVPRCLCINCGAELDAVSEINEKTKEKVIASEGDMTVCINCGWISVFDKDLRLRAPTVEEMVAAANDMRLVAAVGAVTVRNKQRGRQFPFKGTKQ